MSNPDGAARLSGTQSVAEAMRVAESGAVTLIQPMFVLAVAFSHMLVPAAVPLTMHGIAFVAGIAASFARLSPGWLLGATYVACLVDIAVAADDRQLLFTLAFIILVLASVIPILLWDGTAPVVVAAAVAVAGAITTALSHAGGLGNSLRMVLSIVALAIAVIVLMRGIRGFARMIDVEEAAVWEAEQHAIVQRAAAETTAEYARVLHDTVINTFAPLARDSHGEEDCGLIRERCRSNLERVAELRKGPAAPRKRRSLVDIEREALVRIEWVDDAKAVIRDAEPTLPAAVAGALRDCASEAVTNAAKHAGVDAVRVAVRIDAEEMIVEIHDDGRGFDGELVPGRGLAESLFARAEANGIHATLRTTTGRGTTIELRCPTRAIDADTGSVTLSEERRGRAVLARTALVWSLSIHSAAVAIAAMDPEIGPISLTASAVIVFALTFAVWLVARTGRDLPAWLTATTLVLVPFIAWLGYEAGDQARGLGSAFPPLLITGVCVFLLVMRPDRTAFFAAIALMFTGLAVTITFHAHNDAAFAAHGIIMQVPALGMLVAWYLAHRVMLGLAERMARARERRSIVRRRRAVVESAQTLWEQWSDAGLEASLEILRDIDAGRITIDDPTLLETCRREENHLRQVCAIASGGVLMSWWFARALATARARGVELRLQVEGVDVADPVEASAYGTLLVSAVEGSDADTVVTGSMMMGNTGDVTLTIVASGSVVVPGAGDHSLLDVSQQEIGEQTLITVCRSPVGV